jgi:hypothetical protein
MMTKTDVQIFYVDDFHHALFALGIYYLKYLRPRKVGGGDSGKLLIFLYVCRNREPDS